MTKPNRTDKKYQGQFGESEFLIDEANYYANLEEECKRLQAKNEDLRAGQLSLLKHIERLKKENAEDYDTDHDNRPIYSNTTATTIESTVTLQSLAKEFLIADVSAIGLDTSPEFKVKYAIKLAAELLHQLEKHEEE